jgi:outer membrane protein assembly factor BamB
MRIQVTTLFAFLLLRAITAVAEEKIYAPLPDKVVAAKTVFFINESGTARFGDDLYRQIKAWNRWNVVTDRAKADLILVLSPSDTVPVVITTASATGSDQSTSGTSVTAAGSMQTQRWHLYVMDAKTGENLWRADASMGANLWRSWGSIARSLLSDIQKRLK